MQAESSESQLPEYRALEEELIKEFPKLKQFLDQPDQKTQAETKSKVQTNIAKPPLP